MPPPHRARRLQSALERAGYEVISALDARADLDTSVRRLEPDAILVDTEVAGRDALEHLASLGRRYPKPMIVLSDHVAPELTLAAAQAGVTAYAVEDLAGASLGSLVDMAIAHFQAHNALREQLIKAQQSLETRKLVDRAKCRLMERRGIGEEAAYRRLRKMAMDRRMSLTALARELLSAEDGA